jgi:hypothetical protein
VLREIPFIVGLLHRKEGKEVEFRLKELDNMSAKDIYYSNKYYDELFEYR